MRIAGLQSPRTKANKQTNKQAQIHGKIVAGHQASTTRTVVNALRPRSHELQHHRYYTALLPCKGAWVLFTAQWCPDTNSMCHVVECKQCKCTAAASPWRDSHTHIVYCFPNWTQDMTTPFQKRARVCFFALNMNAPFKHAPRHLFSP